MGRRGKEEDRQEGHVRKRDQPLKCSMPAGMAAGGGRGPFYVQIIW